jgi:Ca2+-binding EF-hand superfamily protein
VKWLRVEQHEQRGTFVQAFKTADKRRTGTIPIKSLRDVLETVQKSALTNQQFYVITADADVENSGVLEIGEFLQVSARHNCCLRKALGMSAQRQGKCSRPIRITPPYLD